MFENTCTSWYLTTFVRFVHLFLIMFIIVIPFTNSEYLLTLHAIGLPGLIVHWITNNNMCSLTMLESYLTGENMENTFISKIIHPFFEINNSIIYTIVTSLWLLTLYKLYPTRFRMLRFCIWLTWDYIYRSYEWFKFILFD